MGCARPKVGDEVEAGVGKKLALFATNVGDGAVVIFTRSVAVVEVGHNAVALVVVNGLMARRLGKPALISANAVWVVEPVPSANCSV